MERLLIHGSGAFALAPTHAITIDLPTDFTTVAPLIALSVNVRLIRLHRYTGPGVLKKKIRENRVGSYHIELT